MVYILHREFSYELTGERMLKIDPHLPKLLSNIKWITFLRYSVQYVVRHAQRVDVIKPIRLGLGGIEREREANTDLDVNSQRHDENSDHDVGDCQRRYEVVGDGVQRLLLVDAETDEDVAEHRARREDEQ